MLKLYESTPGTKILSLRAGMPIATIIAPIINPKNFFIEGWFVQDDISKERLVLLSSEIRDVFPQGFVVNDHEVLSELDDLVRLKEVIRYKFDVINLKVVSESGKTYGKVSDYAYETNNMYIQKFYVAQSLIRNFKGGTLSVDRSQIVEVTTKKIIISDPTEDVLSRANSVGAIG